MYEDGLMSDDTLDDAVAARIALVEENEKHWVGFLAQQTPEPDRCNATSGYQQTCKWPRGHEGRHADDLPPDVMLPYGGQLEWV